MALGTADVEAERDKQQVRAQGLSVAVACEPLGRFNMVRPVVTSGHQ